MLCADHVISTEHQMKNLVHCKPIPVKKTWFSLLCTFSHRETPVFINSVPCNENRFFPVWEKYTGKTLFWPCTGPVQDCSVSNFEFFFQPTLKSDLKEVQFTQNYLF